jgi:hypothetical protein
MVRINRPPRMKWLLRTADFYWPTMMADCFCYYKGCEECQKFGNIQLVPAAMLHPIIKPWPFRGWEVGLHWPSPIFEGTPICVVCYGLLY